MWPERASLDCFFLTSTSAPWASKMAFKPEWAWLFFSSVQSSSISSFQTVLQHSEQNYIDKVRIHLLEENTVLLLSANITFMCSYLNNSPGQPYESTESKQYSMRFYYDWSDCNLRQIVPISVTISKPEMLKQLLHVWDRIALHCR